MKVLQTCSLQAECRQGEGGEVWCKDRGHRRGEQADPDEKKRERLGSVVQGKLAEGQGRRYLLGHNDGQLKPRGGGRGEGIA